jgi:hypothetical protein
MLEVITDLEGNVILIFVQCKWYHFSRRERLQKQLVLNVVANNETYFGLHIKCQIFVFDIKRRTVIKISNIKVHENRLNGSDVDTFGQTDRQRNTVTIFAIMRTHWVTSAYNVIQKENNKKKYSNHFTCPGGSRRLRVPEVPDNWYMKVVKLSALHTGCLYPPPPPTWNISGAHIC